MKELDFKPAKSTDSFRSNYKLHDIAENIGKNLFVQWGIDFEEFGGDNRYKAVWEKGMDKPDMKINYKGKTALLDWKAKHKEEWIVNERAVEAYKIWSKELKMPVLIAFFVFNEFDKLLTRRIASLEIHNYSKIEKQWDKNSAVKFENEIPNFTKGNLLKLMKDQNQ